MSINRFDGRHPHAAIAVKQGGMAGRSRCDLALAHFLKAVKDERCFGELHCVYRSIRGAGIVFHDLQHSGPTEALDPSGR
jgi:hypothetical protein